MKALQALLPIAFAEDEGAGDVTSEATLDPEHRSQGELLCKEDGVLAGRPVMDAVFRHRGLAPRVEWFADDGDAVRAGQILARVEGETRGLLACERIILNFMQRLSGIATSARRYADAAAPARVLDTRKTLPAYRELDKYAVAAGGGENHRMGLYDRILVKDNHAAACGSVRAAVDRAVQYRNARGGRALLIEAEARTLDELESLLDAPVDIVMLDNMDDKALKAAVARARAAAPHVKLEASGNLDLERVQRLRNVGLDFFSVGEITHSVKALDLSLKLSALKLGAVVPGGTNG
jgi:nicotinate-nucleotide pyrophosphorylase (carboxylating)